MGCYTDIHIDTLLLVVVYWIRYVSNFWCFPLFFYCKIKHVHYNIYILILLLMNIHSLFSIWGIDISVTDFHCLLHSVLTIFLLMRVSAQIINLIILIMNYNIMGSFVVIILFRKRLKVIRTTGSYYLDIFLHRFIFVSIPVNVLTGFCLIMVVHSVVDSEVVL